MSNIGDLTDQPMKETLGVPVVTYGQTDNFPAFYSPSSGFKVGVNQLGVPQLAHFSYVLESLAGG
jgi:pseudouridine-5'-phosphate glycosidase